MQSKNLIGKQLSLSILKSDNSTTNVPATIVDYGIIDNCTSFICLIEKNGIIVNVPIGDGLQLYFEPIIEKHDNIELEIPNNVFDIRKDI